jgi:DNA-binding NtrC family response regulator
LLVVGASKLDDRLFVVLRDNGWSLLLAESVEEARSLREKHQFLAGLALLPEPSKDDAFRRVRQMVNSLRDLEWVAAIKREDLACPEISRFMVARLRSYHVYPIDPLRLTFTLCDAWAFARLNQAHRRARSRLTAGRFGLVGASPAMRRLYRHIERYADTGLPVLVTGETGTGKELVARALHAQSARAANPFIALNCAAIPTSLVQSELFGVTKGAFTGATTSNEGLIRAARGGTLLLDEVGEMSLDSQASLLRFLEDKVVMPVGGRIGTTVDVNVIASTNRDLHEEARAGRFRLDLLYRLDVLSIKTPPLRERVADIEALAEHFLQAEADALPHRLRGFSPDALDWLRGQAWPGNVRELRSCVLHAGLLCSGAEITAKDLRRARPYSAESRQTRGDIVASAEKAALQQRLARNRGNISKTARELNISRMTLYRLMARHSIART